MTESATITSVRPEQLLFTDAQGGPISLEDLISEGLDGAYRDRVPALRTLLHDGTPRDRLYACLLLTSWGDAEGFAELVAWARRPDHAPWGNAPVEVDRRFGVDAGFERLADAVRASLLLDPDPDLHRRQVDAVHALLAIYDRKYFAITLSVVASDALLRDECAEAARDATAAAMLHAAAPPEPFDLAMQAAFMLAVVAATRDADAAALAEELLRIRPRRASLTREICDALARGHGPATLRVLDSLAATAEAGDAAAAALARRSSAP